jgi:hypothetical protein
MITNVIIWQAWFRVNQKEHSKQIGEDRRNINAEYGKTILFAEK